MVEEGCTVLLLSTSCVWTICQVLIVQVVVNMARFNLLYGNNNQELNCCNAIKKAHSAWRLARRMRYAHLISVV